MTGTAQEVEFCWVQSCKHNKEVTVKRDLLFAASKGCAKLCLPTAKAGDFYKGNSWSYWTIHGRLIITYRGGNTSNFQGKSLILEVPKD